MEENGKNKNFIPAATIGELVDKVSRPRKIVLMVTAGDPVDELVDQLLPHLSLGDIVIDGGNSDFRDTDRRVRFMESRGIWFVGCGISGGAEGALNGPSIMPGGSVEAWPFIKDMLQSIAAKLEEGSPSFNATATHQRPVPFFRATALILSTRYSPDFSV